VTFKISVLTIGYRPGYVDSCVAALKAQSLQDFEWVFVDELVAQRRDLVKREVNDAFSLTHIPPREITDISATAMALNTGIVHCRGELVHFMADYMYLHPRTLERHWEIYQKYGPKVIITGPLLDRLTAEGKSISLGARPILWTIQVGSRPVQYHEHSPPIDWPLKPNFTELTDENLLSIFARPFIPVWPDYVLPDWRSGVISNLSLERGLYENAQPEPWKWWWAGRVDSAPLEALLEANGMDETSAGRRAGLETDMARRMVRAGCRHLHDRLYPSYMLPHPTRKREISDWEDDKGEWVSEGASYSLREERRKIVAV